MGRLPALPTPDEPIRLLGADGRPLDDGGKLPIGPANFFASVWNQMSQTYSYRYDEALRKAPQDALAMLRDLSVSAPLHERYREVMQQPWSIKPEKKKDSEQEEAAAVMTTVIERTPYLPLLFYELEQAVWWGRSASQWATAPAIIDGFRRTVCSSHAMINGDKIQFRYDGTPAVYIRSTVAGAKWQRQGATVGDAATLGVENDSGPTVIYGDRAPMLLLDRHFRKQFVISKYLPHDADYFDAEMAGGIHGVGLRSMIYWAWWIKSELQGWALNYMRKVGTLGLLVFPFIDGNPASEAQADTNIKSASNRTALKVPVPPNADPKQLAPFVISPTTAGIQTLIELMDKYYDWRIERAIIGQSASSRSDTSGLGTHDTGSQDATKYRIIRGDCELLGECLTTDFVAPLQAFNCPGTEKRFRLRFSFDVPDPAAKDRMDAAQAAVSIGVSIKADEVRDACGFTKPGPNDESVGGQQPGMAQAGGAAPGGLGMASPKPDANGTAKPAAGAGPVNRIAGMGMAQPTVANGHTGGMGLAAPQNFDFHPDEPRADDGKWTSGGGTATKAKPDIDRGPKWRVSGIDGGENDKIQAVTSRADLRWVVGRDGSWYIHEGHEKNPRFALTFDPQGDESENRKNWRLDDLKHGTTERFRYRDEAHGVIGRRLTQESIAAGVHLVPNDAGGLKGYAFDESKIHRGQPDNAGQFGKGSGFGLHGGHADDAAKKLASAEAFPLGDVFEDVGRQVKASVKSFADKLAAAAHGSEAAEQGVVSEMHKLSEGLEHVMGGTEMAEIAGVGAAMEGAGHVAGHAAAGAHAAASASVAGVVNHFLTEQLPPLKKAVDGFKDWCEKRYGLRAAGAIMASGAAVAFAGRTAYPALNFAPLTQLAGALPGIALAEAAKRAGVSPAIGAAVDRIGGAFAKLPGYSKALAAVNLGIAGSEAVSHAGAKVAGAAWAVPAKVASVAGHGIAKMAGYQDGAEGDLGYETITPEQQVRLGESIAEHLHELYLNGLKRSQAWKAMSEFKGRGQATAAVQ